MKCNGNFKKQSEKLSVATKEVVKPNGCGSPCHGRKLQHQKYLPVNLTTQNIIRSFCGKLLVKSLIGYTQCCCLKEFIC